ncbi:monodehydroascorbate reductase [Tanacetum coccineum]
MNKLVRGNLVRGLPSKIFENDHSCVACQKGKQHKASCKAKLVNSISKTLHMLHMDLFGPTNVKSLMKKSYCLVVIDDFSRFSWVFFLATKDETSGILKTFITEIENQLDCKVKVIRSDNGTEFKNSIMNQFCEMKGIKREFSVARTPQQNGMSLQRFFKLHNWYQSHGALDLGSTSDKAPKPTSSQPPKPTPTPTKPSKEVQGKKCKLVKETSDAPSPAKRSKVGNMAKNRKSKSPLKLVDEFFDEGVPDKEPAYNDEEANFQRAMELSLKEQEEQTQGLVRPVVFREPDSGRFQPLPDVQGKGKEKVIEEQAAHDLLSLQTPKKKSPTDPFIFQRRTPMTTGPSGNAESPSLDAELDFADSETKSDEPDISVAKDTELEVTYTETLVMTFGIQDGGQGGSDLGKAEEVMKIVEVEQTTEEQIHEEFTSIMYLNVKDNLKLPVEEQVILEELASSIGTLSSLHHLDKSSDAEKEKTHAESEVESMVTVTIQQDTSSVPPMTFKAVDLPRPRPDDPTVRSPLPTTDTSIESHLNDAFTHITDLVQANLNLEERLRKVESYDLSGMIEKQMQGYLQIASNLDGRINKHASRLSALENLNISHKVNVVIDEIVTNAVDWAMQAPL